MESPLITAELEKLSFDSDDDKETMSQVEVKAAVDPPKDNATCSEVRQDCIRPPQENLHGAVRRGRHKAVPHQERRRTRYVLLVDQFSRFAGGIEDGDRMWLWHVEKVCLSILHRCGQKEASFTEFTNEKTVRTYAAYVYTLISMVDLEVEMTSGKTHWCLQVLQKSFRMRRTMFLV